ncbi:MAG: hypothetical protein KME11_04715 [Timaviella obliquedivisa GSE-PSE-MK23-08B]|nr:hypothetical protein [Timaviella obliquedivisa GSE-PSE-MK23-08B]
MKAALISKDYDRRRQFIERFLVKSKSPLAIYIYPKNRKKEFSPPVVPGCSINCFTYEDMLKTDEWLTINALVSKDTALILDNPSRYPKITSTKVLALERIEKMCQVKAIVDIVPFTLAIQYLYTPYSYLGREILGYAHYYAFRENYHEMDAAGTVRMSHDFDLLADKIAPVTEIDYDRFLCQNREAIEVKSTPQELENYQALKDECFAAKDFSPRVVITKLADLAHAFDSRLRAMVDLVAKLQGKTVVLTNLKDYAKRAEKIAKDAGLEITATSYQLGFQGNFDNCIYLESPIVKSYFMLDAESRLSMDCKVFHIVGDTKVDQYLYTNLLSEITQIDQFTQELARAKRRQTSPQNLPAKKCASGGTRENQLALF